MSKSVVVSEPAWLHERRPWGRADLAALAIWTLAIVLFFWDAVTLQRALFYFDITEINFAYREFLAREIRAGRFSRWCPELFCGLPLYSESQAGYLHPLKYVLYPWLPTWQAFNLDTILSIWLTGVGTYGWLRRHVGPMGALTGAGVFGLSGFVWAHLIHTSMTNALTSVPFVIWALEAAWESGRLRPLVWGSAALACQVFAGHLQDTLLTAGLVAVYGVYRAATERTWKSRVIALGFAGGLVTLGVALSAIQWIPSKELLDRSPRAAGLSWSDVTYGSWHPELLPTLVVREAYGTRARDTDWMDGFYPYHEMNTYMGVIAIGLAVAGAAAYRDRWVAFWLILAGIASLLMLGRFTLLFDVMHKIPVVGSSRIPVRFHLWLSLAVAALAAVGTDRLARPGPVNLRGAAAVVLWMVILSIPILLYAYAPVWTEPNRWATQYHLNRFRWLGRELLFAFARTAGLAAVAWFVAARAAKQSDPHRRSRLAALLPVLVIADLLGSHIADVPTVSPTYWTDPPLIVKRVKSDPTLIRVFGESRFSAGEPGYASEPVDFFAVRDSLAWSLPAAWGLSSSIGATPIIPRRMLEYTDNAKAGSGRFELESVTHFISGHRPGAGAPAGEEIGHAYLHRVKMPKPRARLAGHPYYADGELAAVSVLKQLGTAVRERLIVEDPDQPLPVDADVSGTATITRDLPEVVEVSTSSTGASYLVLADTFDPGWSATLDGRSVPIRPAYIAFRAVYLPPGKHAVVFTYRPAGFETGALVSACALAVAIVLLLVSRPVAELEPEHVELGWPRGWPRWLVVGIVAIVLLSSVQLGRNGMPQLHTRWAGRFHRFTWGAGIEAMRPLESRP